MIDRERVEKALQALEHLEEIGLNGSCNIRATSYWELWCFCPAGMDDDKRRKAIGAVTPLVGQMNLVGDGWFGSSEGMRVSLYGAQACKIIGYKMERKEVRREIEREPEFETVEEEVQVPITDCDLKSGRFSEDDIETRA